ncbi:sensor histidine kinase [Phreatobacter sp.]|uniref:sensor histidine kinase n=1 Tax=Phreatobacter sp. TaxID=1966341 RepID=UPI003F72C134
MVLVVVPIAVVAAVTALVTYRLVLTSIEASQRQAVGSFVVRTNILYREMVRGMMVAGQAVAAGSSTAADCQAVARRLADRDLGIEGVYIRIAGRVTCAAGRAPALTDEMVTAIDGQFRTRPPTPSQIGNDLAEARYGTVATGGRRYLVIQAAGEPDAAGQRIEGLFLVNAAVLDGVFDMSATFPGTIVALVQQPDQVVIARGDAEAGQEWLPRSVLLNRDFQRWRDTSRGGVSATYASRRVAEPDLYLLARFDDAAEQAAFLQFLMLLLTPLVTLLVLFGAYSYAIDRHILRWIRGIQQAAIARSSSEPRLAPVDAAMPGDIRAVSESFNTLVIDQAEKLASLNLALDANRQLLRELHHRVKNSLQVVQSYLSLARRQNGEAHRAVLSAVEAKIHVLSIAYRLALSQGEMRPVPLKPFLNEIALSLNSLLHDGQSWVSADCPDKVGLPIDRAIPLGLLVVEIASHAVNVEGADHLDVRLVCESEGDMTVEVVTDVRRSQALKTRVAHGLLRQLEAEPLAGAASGSLGRWRISAELT